MSVEAARRRCDEALRSSVYDLAHAAGTEVRLPAGFAEDWLLATNPAIVERWHEAVDADRSNFAQMDRAAYEALRDALAGDIEDVRLERHYRRLEAQRAEADAELGTTSADR